MTPRTANITGSIVLLVGVLIILCVSGWPITVSGPPGSLWVGGAAALGLVSGFTTGVSSQPGSGQEFVKFVGAGVLVPLLGAVAALRETTQKVTESSTYSDSLLVKKITETVTVPSEGSFHPLAVMGSFFIVFAIVAAFGIVGGVLLRKGGTIEVKFT